MKKLLIYATINGADDSLQQHTPVQEMQVSCHHPKRSGVPPTKTKGLYL